MSKMTRGPRCQTTRMVMPPSTGISAPEMNSFSAKEARASATSSGCGLSPVQRDTVPQVVFDLFGSEVIPEIASECYREKRNSRGF